MAITVTQHERYFRKHITNANAFMGLENLKIKCKSNFSRPKM